MLFFPNLFPFLLYASTIVFQIAASERPQAQALLLKNSQHSVYMFFEEDIRTGILVDITFELGNRNNHGFCNHIFTQNIFIFTELRKSPLTLNLSVNITIVMQINSF